MSPSTAAARAQMVTQQIRAWAVLDPAVLEAIGAVPRERFLPAEFRTMAYADADLPLPGGQRTLTPQVAGRILQALQVSGGDRVLEVGTGSGFLTACLCRLARHVTSLEIDPALAESARRALRDTGAQNVEVLTADVFQWRPVEQFDCIAVTGSLPVPDLRFQEWLAPGGRLFLTIGAAPAMEAWLIRRTDGGFERESLFETVIPALINAPRPDTFAF